MKLRVMALCDVDVPDTALGGAATPDAVVDLAKRTCEARLNGIWQGWGHTVNVTVSMVPDGNDAKGT